MKTLQVTPDILEELRWLLRSAPAIRYASVISPLRGGWAKWTFIVYRLTLIGKRTIYPGGQTFERWLLEAEGTRPGEVGFVVEVVDLPLVGLLQKILPHLKMAKAAGILNDPKKLKQWRAGMVKKVLPQIIGAAPEKAAPDR